MTGDDILEAYSRLTKLQTKITVCEPITAFIRQGSPFRLPSKDKEADELPKCQQYVVSILGMYSIFDGVDSMAMEGGVSELMGDWYHTPTKYIGEIIALGIAFRLVNEGSSGSLPRYITPLLFINPPFVRYPVQDQEHSNALASPIGCQCPRAAITTYSLDACKLFSVRGFVHVNIECVPSSFIWQDLAITPNLAPVFSTGSATVLDLDPSHALDSNFNPALGFNRGPVFNFSPGPNSASLSILMLLTVPIKLYDKKTGKKDRCPSFGFRPPANDEARIISTSVNRNRWKFEYMRRTWDGVCAPGGAGRQVKSPGREDHTFTTEETADDMGPARLLGRSPPSTVTPRCNHMLKKITPMCC
ncbi:hypothetical protein EVAR_11347_1 [Eumeta japonica]|uniref:Uncharacterized protein n=1 Tax=Eumeta variegata TaxID=151549 RepID=A0A4C1U193_EUMVA|nr:hypothetical protein EVAR_11347_1 [Eumeta japonica]